MQFDTPRVSDLRVDAYRIPTADGPESDGTLVWDATTMVVVEVEAADVTGIGYTYGHEASAVVVRETLKPIVVGERVAAHPHVWSRMFAAVRNVGRGGIAAMAISAVDVALWDLKAKLLRMSLPSLIGVVRERVPIYGSGGFTSMPVPALCDQLAGWVRSGIARVKMKVGREPATDARRVADVRHAIGAEPELFVDANGAYVEKQALHMADSFEESGVSWFEEPVHHRDVDALSRLRRRLPGSMELASGEYGFTADDFAHMIDANSIDVLQADATRCGGFTGLLGVDAMCLAKRIPLSTHCAPYLHLAVAPSLKTLRHMEYFADHVRIERMLFDGAREPDGGTLSSDASVPGIGLTFKRADAARYAA